jgi:phage gpG-like protein
LRELVMRVNVQVPGGTGPIDFRPIFPDILALIQKATEDNFEGSHDPEGDPWEPITEFTMQESVNPHRDGRPLIDTGNLLEKATQAPMVEETENTLKVGTPPPEGTYGALHQQGGWNQRGYRIPQRQYRGWNRKMIEEVKAIVKAHAIAVLQGRLKP